MKVTARNSFRVKEGKNWKIYKRGDTYEVDTKFMSKYYAHLIIEVEKPKVEKATSDKPKEKRSK